MTDPGKKLSALEPALPEKGARHRGWAALRRALSRAPVNAIRPSVPAFSSAAEATTSSCRSPKCFRAFSPSTLFLLLLMFFSHLNSVVAQFFLPLSFATGGNDFLCEADKAAIVRHCASVRHQHLFEPPRAMLHLLSSQLSSLSS